MSTQAAAEMVDLGSGLSYVSGATHEIAGTPATKATIFNVVERTELAVKALSSLGLVADSAKAAEFIGQDMQSLHDKLVADRQLGDPEVEPFKALTLQGAFSLSALRRAFDNYSGQPQTYVFSELWDRYSSDELNKRTLTDEAAKPVPSVLAMQLGGDRTDLPGLYFTGQNLKKQIKSVEQSTNAYAQTHTATEQLILNPADVFVLNAQRREEGRALLDAPTVVRFIQLAMKAACGDSWVPDADSDDGQVGLRGSYGGAHSRGGVRVSVGPKA